MKDSRKFYFSSKEISNITIHLLFDRFFLFAFTAKDNAYSCKDSFPAFLYSFFFTFLCSGSQTWFSSFAMIWAMETFIA